MTQVLPSGSTRSRSADRLALALGILCLFLFSGCGGDGTVTDPDGSDTQGSGSTTSFPDPSTPSAQTPPSPTVPAPTTQPQARPPLEASHKGWKKTSCNQCHQIPLPDHRKTGNAECAVCHGGNGACNPNAKQPHDESMDCLSCHRRKHNFSKKIECIYCHLTTPATVTCTP